MAQITSAQRGQRIQQLLNELNKVPPERHEVERLPALTGEPILCPVIKLGVDEVLLNHRSHRVRAQLEDDQDWQEFSKDPHSEPAQRLIERYVKRARSDEEFNTLKESLRIEGQTDPGVMTSDGVLINANTRAVAMRELDDPNSRWIRVAVLPQTAQPEQLGLLELRLQMRKELKVDYTLTNELLFIEELSCERKLSDAQIARELRLPGGDKKGASEVNLRLRLLDLIRQLQRIRSQQLPLTFFDTLGYEQLREVHRSHAALLEHDPAAAQRYLESFLLSVSVGVTPVHQIRSIDEHFMAEYMLPQLEEDELVGDFASKLAAAPPESGPGESAGGARIAREDDGGVEEVDAKGLIEIVTGRDKRVEVSDTKFVLDRDDIRDSLKAAIITGVKEKKRDSRDADKLEAPIAAVKAATRELGKALDALAAVAHDSDFDQRRRKSLEAAHKKLKRSARSLEAELVKTEIIEG